MPEQRLITAILVLGTLVLIPVAYSATQQVFQAGTGAEIISDTGNVFDITSTSTTGGAIHIRARDTGTGIYIDTSNNVGVGTTTPDGVFQVYAPSGQIIFTPIQNAAETTNNIGIEIRSSNYIGGNYATRLVKADEGGGIPLYVQGNLNGDNTTWTNLARFGAYTGDNDEFEVFGDIYASGNIAAGGNLTANVSAAQVSAGTFGSVAGKGNYRFDATGSTNPILFVDATNERVGIGTTGPGYKLEVYGRQTGGGTPQLTISAPDTADGSYTYLNFKAGTDEIAQIYANYVSSAGTGQGDLRFNTNNQDVGGPQTRMTILANGDVGIGTTSPQDALSVSRTNDARIGFLASDIHGTIDTWQIRNHYNSISWTDQYLSFASWDGSTRQDRMTLLGNGNVGIGTTSPGANLHVYGSGIQRIRVESSDNQAGISFMSNSTVENVVYSPNSTDDLRFYVNGADRMSITSTGNVGIGTTSPSSNMRLQVSSASTGAGVRAGVTNSDASNFVYLWSGFSGATNDAAVVWDSVGHLRLGTESTIGTGFSEKMRIETGGNVGIGTTSPGQKLTVAGTIESTSGGVKFPDGTIQTSAAAGVTKSVSTNWGYYVNTSINGAGAHILNVRVTGNNSTWNGSFAVQGENSYTPNELWNNVKMLSWTGYNAAVDDVQVLIMSNSTTAQFGSTFIVIKTNAIAGGAAATMTVSVNGTNASSLSLSSSVGAPYTYTMSTSAGTYQIYQVTNGNVGIGTTNPSSYKLDVSGSIRATGAIYANANGGNYFCGGDDTCLWDINVPNTIGIYGTQDSTVGSVKLGSGGGIISGSGGNIGIGTTGPASTLDVRSGSGGGISGPTSGTWTARIVNNQDASGQNGLSVQNRWNSTDSYIFEAAKGWNGTAVGYYPVFTINGLGNVGIGTRSPSSTLHIVPGQVRLAGTTNPYLGLNDGTYQAYLEIASGAMRLYHNGVDRLNITAATDSVITLTPGSTNGKVVIAGSGKLDAATVDPVYTIGGKRYATYLPGMTGVKEETTGVAQLSKLNFNNSEVQLQYIIDFNKAEIGSDLWLFAQAINISGRAYVAPDGKVYRTSAEEIFDNFSVLLSPGFDGRVWYEKDVESRTITIYAVPSNSLEIRNSSFEVSYRLTAPRFDWKYWTNYSDSEWEGLNLDKSLR